jgi:hypothetical protein
VTRHGSTIRLACARARSLAAVAAITAGLALDACGSTDPAALGHPQQQGTAAAQQQNAITSLQKKLKTLEAQTGKHPAATVEKPTPPPVTPVTPAPIGLGDSRIPASGTFTGQAQQRGEPASVNQDFEMAMTFSSAGSSVSYPTLACYGRLTPAGFSGQDRVYTETITSGPCDTGGTWYVKVDSATQIEAQWSLNTASYTVAAVLTR